MEDAANNRHSIIEASGRMFRERGFDAVPLVDLMKAAGFTHGGFYNHFASKEAITAEACSMVMARSNADLAKTLGGKTSGTSGQKRAKAWRHYLHRYLSLDHPHPPDPPSALPP